MRNHSELKRLFLATAGLAVLAVAVFLGFMTLSLWAQAPSTQSPSLAAGRPSFDVASVKSRRSLNNKGGLGMDRGEFKTTGAGVTTEKLIQFAYDLQDDQILGGPSWVNSIRYDIDANVEAQKLPVKHWESQIELMVQSLLADRFKLKVHHEMKKLESTIGPVDVLVIDYVKQPSLN